MSVRARQVTKTAGVLLLASLAILGVMQGLSAFAGDGSAAKPLVRNFQRLLGILPSSYEFGSCSVLVPKEAVILTAQHHVGGRLWTLGFFPSIQPNASATQPFHILSTIMRSPEVALEWMSPAQQQQIQQGKERCLKSGACTLVLDALGSGKDGLRVGDSLPWTLLVPEIGLSVTAYTQDLAWVRCVRSQGS